MEKIYVNFDEITGEILGFYPESLYELFQIPDPKIQIESCQHQVVIQDLGKYKVQDGKIIEKQENKAAADLFEFELLANMVATSIKDMYSTVVEHGLILYKDNLYVGHQSTEEYRALERICETQTLKYMPFFVQKEDSYAKSYAELSKDDQPKEMLNEILDLLAQDRVRALEKNATQLLELEKIVSAKNLTRLKKFQESLHKN